MIRYEFLMQIRKRSLWISSLLIVLLLVVTQGDRGPRYLPADLPAREVMGTWALLLSILLPVGFGMALADRLVRDRRLGVTNLLDSLPAGTSARLTGRYLGSAAATGVPGLVAMFVAAGFEFADRRDPALLLWAPVAFALVLLPGLAFVAAFALTVPLLVSAPLFRVLFVGYWFWGNMLPPAMMPSLTGSLLTPLGDYPASWLLDEPVLYAGAHGWLGFLRPDPDAAAAALSIVLLLLLSLAPLALTGTLLSRRRTVG